MEIGPVEEYKEIATRFSLGWDTAGKWFTEENGQMIMTRIRNVSTEEMFESNNYYPHVSTSYIQQKLDGDILQFTLVSGQSFGVAR